MSAFDKLDPAARRAAFAHMSAADRTSKAKKSAGGAARRMALAKQNAGPLRVSSQYVRTGRPSKSDVDTLVEAYQRMHGKPPSAAQLARLRGRAK